MTANRATAAVSAVRNATERLPGVLGLLGLLLALSACSSQDRATGPKEVRELAGSTQARQSREAAEEPLRTMVRAYDENTPLTLGLVTVNDRCVGGAAKEWFFQTGDDQYKIRCTMSVTAYYGADPHRIGDVLDGIFTAGDHDSSAGAAAGTIPFGHDDFRRRLVAYYRGHGQNPTGPGTPEPAQVFDPWQTLSWDTVRSAKKSLVAEPDPCVKSDPPVTRCLREPASKTVADIRRQYGMVFELQTSMAEYYRVSKNGKTS
ncbi:hypothetical protein [Streptomyces sp. NBC_00316]|uniref:hypothetical protein n=1 Tax=Streptomyces sp. NBC_00316 TaxID=2975710 RepID=UPI002E2C172E|nr:hypothetical protein [Streptomyces sp. NBC_00316]